MKKGFLTMCVLIICCSSIFAQGTTKKLVVAGESGSPYMAFFKDIAGNYINKTGIQIEFIDIPHDNMHERFVQEAISQSGSIDIFNADQPWISEFASRKWIEPLSKKISATDKADFFKAAIEASSYKGELYAIPYFIHTPVLYYRTDLFEKAGLKPPTTWEEFRKCAKVLTNVKIGQYGTIIEGKQAGEPVTHLIDWLYQNGANFIDDQGKVTINSKPAAETFEFLLDMMYKDQSVMPGSVGYDNADVHNIFMQGKVAMVKNWPYMYAMAKDPNQSTVAGKFSIIPQPKGKYQKSAVWTWGFAISTSSKNKDAAWDFIKWATSAENLAKMGIRNINPVPRASSLEMVKADKSLDKKDIEAIKIMSEAVTYGQNATESPKFPAIQSELSVILSRILSRQESVLTGLDNAEIALKQALAQ